MQTCKNLNDVRQEIDKIDAELISLIAKRECYVQQAANFKKTTADVKAPDRVEQVISKVKARAKEVGANETVVEATYRAMISAFIDIEIINYQRINSSK
ncbi:MAG: Chorismate mutase family protein [Firmicutes bacterium]|nr:Chorismate mutase family protein [Bacillota bacterium]